MHGADKSPLGRQRRQAEDEKLSTPRRLNRTRTYQNHGV
jgi:hypothetical protein